jgi:hypothetical protein|tara:strand:- start:105 stop:341 length:237 start_codon:yes stop_codon:yes gene_type:complete
MTAKFYGETASESEATEMLQSRQIVAEIMNFGVRQEQILHIIKLLALELEDRGTLQSICDAINDVNQAGVSKNQLIGS